MEERTTRELIETLGSDFERSNNFLTVAMEKFKSNPEGNFREIYEFHARNIIRSALSYIEAVTYSVKVSSINKCMELGIEVSDHERYLSIEIDGALNDKGEIIERSSKIRLSSNIRFAFKLLEKAERVQSRFDPQSEWWSCLKETIRVRDRLTHPRLPEDVDISPEETLKAVKAVVGFESVLLTENERKNKA